MFKKIAFTLCSVLLALVGVYPVAAANRNTGATYNTPIVMVHGYASGACPNAKPSSTFAYELVMLHNLGYNNPTDVVSYYACDNSGSDISTSGDPNTYFSGGAYNNGRATDNTDIRHLSYQLAWYIYNKYSSINQPVQIFAHSMGGLITAWMLYQIQTHNPVFPPYLYVQNAVTISTPYDGTNDGNNNVSWCPSSTQCNSVLPGSEFITELQTYGKNPQATNGTDWTALGGSPCDVISTNPSGTTTDNGNIHKIIYYSGSVVCYTHLSYLTDLSNAVNVPIEYSNPGMTTLGNATWVHSLYAASLAINSTSY